VNVALIVASVALAIPLCISRIVLQPSALDQTQTSSRLLQQAGGCSLFIARIDRPTTAAVTSSPGLIATPAQPAWPMR